jgi:Zn-dependent protease
MEELVATLAIWALPVILAITLHEAAHGYVARHFGDPTAYLAGRISLNPLRHIDAFGTLILPAIILATSSLLGGSPILFGWAKPVPVDFSRLRNPKADMLWVAAAGPGANLIMAAGWALLLKLGAGMSPENTYSTPLMHMSEAGIQINSVLMLLNLLPIPPLDGGRIAVSLLPHHLAWKFARLEPFGFPILLLLLFTGLLGAILWPLLSGFRHLLSAIFQI